MLCVRQHRLSSSSSLVRGAAVAAALGCGAGLSALGSQQRRQYQTMLSGHDQLPPTLWEALGFTEDTVRAMDRTPEELRLGLIREAKKLSPSTKPQDAVRLETIVKAYTALSSSPAFRAQYAAHHCSSVDANLHVLVEGGEHGANFNPEHQTFDFSGRGPGDVRPFGQFKQAFESAVDAAGAPRSVGATSTANGAATSTASRMAEMVPSSGADIPFTMRLSFDEAVFGCHKVVAYARLVACKLCRNTGDKDVKGARPKCSMCNGLGKVTLPSSTYLVETPCAHCRGDGRQMPQRCGACKGSGAVPKTERLPIQMQPGATSATTKTVPGKGDAGRRGGRAGDLKISVVVEEHRLFQRVGNDLHVALPVPLSTALLGGFLTAPTLRGETQVYIPPGVRSGEVLSVDGGGVPRAVAAASDAMPDGKLRVHVIVVIPNGAQLTGRQKNALRTLANDGDAASNPSGGAGAAAVSSSDHDDEATRSVRLQVLADLKSKFGAQWFGRSTPANAQQ